MSIFATPYEYTDIQLVALLPLPRENDHKYSRGMVECVVGSSDYPGAACLVARAAERTGAGYTKVYTAPEAVHVVRASSPSVVVTPLRFLDDAQQVGRLDATHPGAVVLGSGFDPQDPKVKSLVCEVLDNATAPVLVDGGALSCLSSKKARRILRSRFEKGLDTIITPHAGEAARLAKPFDFGIANPARLCQCLSLALGVTCLLKGPISYVSDGYEVVRVNKGTPALAKAGTGDVLAGMIGALLCQEVSSLGSCVLGASLHGLAGCAAELDLTSICVIATDLPDYIPSAIQSLIRTGL